MSGRWAAKSKIKRQSSTQTISFWFISLCVNHWCFAAYIGNHTIKTTHTHTHNIKIGIINSLFCVFLFIKFFFPLQRFKCSIENDTYMKQQNGKEMKDKAKCERKVHTKGETETSKKKMIFIQISSILMYSRWRKVSE